MYRRILKSLVLGFAVAAFAAPAALAEPRGPSSYSPEALDALSANWAAKGRLVGSPDAASFYTAEQLQALGTNWAAKGRLVGSPDAASFSSRGTDPVAQVPSSDDRALYRGTSPQLDPTVVGSPDDRNVYRGVETDAPLTITLSPAIRGEQVKSFDRPSMGPVSQPSITVSTDDGFQWVDAGLGAASTLAPVLLMGAAGLMFRHQRRRLATY
jgi:hypothetical protein